MLEDLINSVSKTDAEKDYWFVRTDNGIHFETYVQNNFIGIGWNEITLNDLRTKTPDEIKGKIADVYNIDIALTRGKGQVSAIFNKLKRFQNLKKGDLIIIPSANSSRFAFGIIADQRIYVDADQHYNCDYYKRRKVEWLDVKNVRDLDPIFYQVKNTRHAISSINDYDTFIDAVTDVVYKKDGFSYYVLDVNTHEDINIKPLVSLVENLQILLERINQEFVLNEDTNDSSIKLNLQSPGKIIIKLRSGTSLILLAVLLALANGCAPNDLPVPVSQAELDKLENVKAIDTNVLDSINHDMQVLEVDINKVNSFK
ncbi:hypothetical protein [Pedobacter sp. KLB.chiD]|uniref:hypothetical protein n=1 Tax=Pedobacter sp. KLB.chiD TaxID=3387402 RepID=UPI00399B3250